MEKKVKSLFDQVVNCRWLLHVVAFLISVSPNASAFEAEGAMDSFNNIIAVSGKKHSVKSGFYLVPISKDGNICNAFDNFEKKNTKATIHSFLKRALQNLHSQRFTIDSFKTLYGVPAVSREDMDTLEFIKSDYYDYLDSSYVQDSWDLINECTEYTNLSKDQCENDIAKSVLSHVLPENGYYTSKFSITGEFPQESEQVTLLYTDSKKRKGFSCSFEGDGVIVSHLQKPYLQMSSDIRFDFRCHDLNNKKHTFSPEITKSQLESFRDILSTTVLNEMSDFSKVDIPDPSMDIGTLDGGKTNKLTCF